MKRGVNTVKEILRSEGVDVTPKQVRDALRKTKDLRAAIELLRGDQEAPFEMGHYTPCARCQSQPCMCISMNGGL